MDGVAAFCGCLAAGAIAVPAPYLLPRRSGQRIAAICRDARPAAVLTTARLAGDTEVRAGARELGSDVPWIATDADAEGPLEDGMPAAPAGEAAAFLQYTSGSTAAPKGAVITHGNLAANVAMMIAAFGGDDRTRMVSWLPMFHDMGLVCTVLGPLFLGATSVQMSPLAFLQKPARWLRAIDEWRATHSCAPNFAYDLCARVVGPAERDRLDLASWRVAVCAAEPVRAATLDGFASAFAGTGFRRQAFHPCYGMAETTVFATGGRSHEDVRVVTVDGDALAGSGSVVAAAPGSATARPVVSSGGSGPGQRLAIVDPETRRRRPEGAVGEIWIAGPHVAAGYWQRPAETAAAFGARLAEGEDGGADWLRTGDLGFVLDGELYVTGRIKDLLIVRGAKHHPEDIERTVAESHPALAGAAGAAFAVDDGEEARVVVAQEVDRAQRARLDAAAVERAARADVLDRHGIRLHQVVLLRPGALPRTTSGKVQRHLCRAAYEEGALRALSAVR